MSVHLHFPQVFFNPFSESLRDSEGFSAGRKAVFIVPYVPVQGTGLLASRCPPALLARVLRCASGPRAPCFHFVWLGLSCARHNAAPNLCQLRRALPARKPPTTMPTTSSCNAWRVRGRSGRSSRHLRVRRRAPKPPTTPMWSVWTMLACASHPTRCQQVGRRWRLRRPVCNTWADSTSRSSRMRGKTARQRPRWFKPRGPSPATTSSETPSPTRSVSDGAPIALRLRSEVL